MAFPDQREKSRRYAKQWIAENQGKSTEYQRRSRKKRKLDPAFTINERMSAGIRGSLVHGKQGWRWEKLVGYTLADLMTHLEKQFLKGMTWENRGAWHIDHITPISSFKFETPEDPEFRAGWALSNLRPLWAEENHQKKDTRTHLI